MQIVETIPKWKETDRKGPRKSVKCPVSHVTCQVSCVICHLSPFTCHLSLTLTASATVPPTANSPIMHSWLVAKKQKPKKIQNPKNHLNGKKTEIPRGRPILVIKRGFRNGTHKHKDTQLTEIAT